MHGSMAHNHNANNQISNDASHKYANEQYCYLKQMNEAKENKLIKLFCDLFNMLSFIMCVKMVTLEKWKDFAGKYFN